MTNELSKVKIISVNEKESEHSGEGALFKIALDLSYITDDTWDRIFNKFWQQHFYMKKRKAFASAGQIFIICMPSEMQSDHVKELNEVISQTNTEYFKISAEQDRFAEEQIAKKTAERKEIMDLKSTLKFD